MKSFRQFITPLLAILTVGVVVHDAVVVRRNNTEIGNLRSSLKEAEQQIAVLSPKAARAWRMPVQVQKIPDGRLVLTNQSDAPLPVTFCLNGARGQSVVIPKGRARMVEAEPGDVVEISSGTFDPIVVRASGKSG